MAMLCPVAVKVFNKKVGPCPALTHVSPGKYECGIARHPERWSPARVIAHGLGKVRDAALLLIGAGAGCDARINGEPINHEFYKALRITDRRDKDKIREAKRIWQL